jgi:Flp pilus assembly protein TadD
MKRLVALLGLILAVSVWQARAQSLDEQYVRIYNLIQQADALNAADDQTQALARYLEAQTDLQRLQQLNPGWNEKVVKFRLNYLATKIGGITTKAATPTLPATASQPTAKTPVPEDVQRELNSLQEEVRRLQADRSFLEAKLKEALSTQPAAIDPRELAKAESRIQSLTKENDLLKASLDQEKNQPPPDSDTRNLEQMKQALAETNRKLDEQTERADALAVEKHALQARLDGLNASPQNAVASDADRNALQEGNRKLALENEILQSQVRELTASAEAADALRTENQLLKRQLADAKSAARPSGKVDDTARQLQEAQAQLAALQSDAEILRLEKTALQHRVKQISAAPATNAVLPATGQAEALERIKRLEQERAELQKKLDAANKELYGRDSRKVVARMDELSGEIARLRARLQVFEARAVPYTAEELAMMKQSTPRITPADSKAGKRSSRELPTGTAAMAAEAQRLFSAREFAKAEEKYLEMLRQDEKSVYTLANLAAIQLELNRLNEAEKNIKQALAESPEDAFSLSILGYVKFRQEKYDEALDALSRAAELNPESAEIQNYLGVTLSHKGLRGPAETALRKAITLDPKYGSAHNNLAVIYLSQQPPFPDLARWHYQKALAAGHPPNTELEKLLNPKPAKSVVLPPVE